MTLPLVVEMTVDTGNSYELSAETNQHEINLDNELEINVTQYTAPTYEGAYTVDAGLSAVTLETDGKVCTDDIVVNALTENQVTGNSLTINTSTGKVSSLVSISAGYSPSVFGVSKTLQLSTQAGTTITPTTSEQTAVASGKYTLGAVKVGAIPSQYADITGVTANASDVLAGKYFVNNLGVLTLGTAIAGGGDGAPMPVDTVAEMIDTTKVYLYVGSETGYTFGNWYYYNGSAWVSGGKWGADGGVNTNARNLLDYILERVAYTETGMQVYIDALYEALAQVGSVTTTYTITNALIHVTNSNTATGCEDGDSYTGTLTADTDYNIDTVTVTMGGVDITSTAYNNGVITIASVTGDIVITATGISVHALYVLPAETTFDGTNWIDTLVKPFETTGAFTIAFDVTPSSSTPNLSCIYRCGEPRFVRQSTSAWRIFTNSGAVYFEFSTSNLPFGKRSKCVITRSNTTSYTLDIATEDGGSYSTTFTKTSGTSSNTLYIAKNQGNPDTYNFKGTMYDFEIIDYAWTSAEIATYLTF